jgi:hypothetical protein
VPLSDVTFAEAAGRVRALPTASAGSERARRRVVAAH